MGAPRLQLNVVSRTGPLIALVGEQIVNAEGLVGRNTEFGEIQINKPGLQILMVKIDDDQNHIFLIGICFAVADEKRLIGRMKSQGAIAVQRQMFLANFVDARNKGLQVLRSSMFQ